MVRNVMQVDRLESACVNSSSHNGRKRHVRFPPAHKFQVSSVSRPHRIDAQMLDMLQHVHGIGTDAKCPCLV